MIRKLLFSVCVLLLSSGMLYAQRTVTGTVSDDTGPLPGASVLVKGTTTGTSTDFDGNFSISVPDDNAILEVRFVGYETVEIPVGSQSVINVTLSSDGESLDEVIVNALGFTENRDKMASTYSKIEAEKLVQPAEYKVIDGMAGKASGVQISGTSGDPGAGSNIQIRGVSSLGGTSQPLIIVDGVPYNNDNISGQGDDDPSAGVSQQSRLNDLNPDDIETFQIYKGASAGALYGSRALNGVIVITTKKGKAGRFDVTVSTGISFDQVKYKHPLQKSFGQGTSGNYSPTSAFSWGDRISDRSGGQDLVDTGGQRFESLVSDNIIYPIDEKNSTNIYTDENFDQVFQTGVTYNNRFTLSSGTEKGTFFFSGGHIYQEGVVKSSYYRKTNFTATTSQKLTDKLTANIKANYYNTGSNRTQQGSNTAGLYLGLLRTPPDFDITDYVGNYVSSSGAITEQRHRSYRRYLGNSDNAIYNNPLWTINEQSSQADMNRFVGTAEFVYNWNNNISSVLRGGIDFYGDNRVYFFPYYTAGSARRYGLLQDETIANQEINFDFITTFDYDLTEELKGLFTVGVGANDRQRKISYNEATNFIANFREPLDPSEIAAKENITAEITRTYRRNVRLYGTANFDWRDQLILTLGGAYEKHSSLPENNNGFFYPSAELGWTFSKLWENSGPVSFAKLRLAYGQVANVPLPHREQTIYEVGSYSTFSDAISLEDWGGGYQLDERLGNSNLKPEIKTEYEIGVDLRFMKNKMRLTGTYYQNRTDDVLLDIALAPSLGYDEIYGNGASIENKGFELEFQWDFLKKGDWNASAGIVYSQNRNLVIDKSGEGRFIQNFTPGSSVQSVAIEGQPLGVLYTQGALRDDNGDFVLDANGFPVVDTGGNLIVGDPNPDWIGGLNASLSWRDLSFNILFDTSQGNDMAQRTRFITSYFGTHADVGVTRTLDEDLINRDGTLFPAGSVVRGNVEDFGAGNVLLDERYYRTLYGFGDGKLNEFAVSDASWTRLREVSLRYFWNMDKYKAGLKSIEFAATGRNLVIWTDVVGIDPDINQFGIGRGKGLDYFSNPGTANYALNIKLNF